MGIAQASVTGYKDVSTDSEKNSDVNSGTASSVHHRGVEADANRKRPSGLTTFAKRHDGSYKWRRREDRYFSGRDVRELNDAKANDGLARPPSRGSVENLLTAHERADSGILVRMTRDEDAKSRVWFHSVQRAPVSSQTRTVKLVTIHASLKSFFPLLSVSVILLVFVAS